MKLLVGIILFIWVLCGLVGAWRLDDLDLDHWQAIARGRSAGKGIQRQAGKLSGALGQERAEEAAVPADHPGAGVAQAVLAPFFLAARH